MTNKLTVSLFGHRTIEDAPFVEQKLYELLRIIIQGNREVEFLVGRNGEFDLMAASVIRRLKKEIYAENVFLTLVLPYETAELINNIEAFENYYDSIEICEACVDKSFKQVFAVRNRDMVDRSDMVVFFVKNQSGGAYQTLKYAEKNEKKIVNIYYTQNEN